MTLVVKSSDEDTISLPAWLMALLDLQEGDEIKPVIEGQTLHLTPLDRFLALKGILREDQEFDSAMKFLDQAWQSWTIPDSV